MQGYLHFVANRVEGSRERHREGKALRADSYVVAESHDPQGSCVATRLKSLCDKHDFVRARASGVPQTSKNQHGFTGWGRTPVFGGAELAIASGPEAEGSRERHSER